MRITADTNLLLRVVNEDDPVQARLAEKALAEAELVAIPLQVLCELAWVLRRGYKASAAEVARVIRELVDAANVEVDRRPVAAGLAMLDASGDFADGIIAYEGAELGGETFISFDRKAVALLRAQGVEARLLG